MKKISIIALVLLSCMNNAFSLSTTDTYRTEETPNNDPKVYAYISAIAVAAPLNHFLLVKKGNDICAIRFTDYRRGYDNKEPSLFGNGEENLYAEYDWYYLGKNQDFVGKNGHEKLNRAPSVQIFGFHAFLPGNRSVKCGELRLGWYYPIAVSYLGGGGTYLHDVGIALTTWTEVGRVLNFVCKAVEDSLLAA
jgi:hypothetical protein